MTGDSPPVRENVTDRREESVSSDLHPTPSGNGINACHQTLLSSTNPAVLPPGLEQFLAVSGDAVLIVGSDRRVHFASATANALYAHPIGQITGLTFDDLYPPDHIPEEERPLDWIVKQAERSPNGLVTERCCPFSHRWYEYRVQFMPLPEGLVGALIVMRDIDSRRSLQDQYARAVNASQDGISEIDHSTDSAYYSPRWKEMTDCFDLPDPFNEQARCQYWWDRVHPDDKERLQTHYRQWRQEGKPFGSITFRLGFKDDEGQLFYRWFVERGQVERDHQGNPIRTTGVLTDITQLKQAESSLAAEKARFERSMDAVNEGLWETDFTIPTADGEGVTYRSPAWMRLMGLQETDVQPEDPYLRRAILEQIHPEDRERYEQARYGTLHDGKPFVRTEFRVRHPDGAYRWVVIRGKSYRDPEGKILRVVGVVTDIHDRKQAELALATRDRFLAQVARAIPNILYVYDRRDDTCLYVNEELTDTLGYTAEEIQALGPGGILHLIHPDDLPHYTEQALQIDTLADNDYIILEFRVLHKNGEYRWVRNRIVPFARDQQGNISQTVGVTEDITAQKSAEEERQLLLDRYRLAALGTQTGIWEWGTETNQSYRSPEWKTILGYTGEYAKDCPPDASSITHPDDIVQMQAAFEALLSERIPVYDMTYRVRHRDGSWRWLHSRGVLFRTEETGKSRVVGIYTDVTARKQQEDAVREASHRLERAIAASRDAIWELTMLPGGKSYLYRSPQFWNLFGFAEAPQDKLSPETGLWEEFDGEDLWQTRIHPEDYKRIRQYRLSVFENGEGTTETEYRIRRNDGQYRWVLSRSRVERNEAGQPVFLTGVIADIHQRKEAEQLLRQSEQEQRLLLEAVRRSEERYRALTTATSDGIFRADTRGTFIWLSPALQDSLQPETVGETLPQPGTPDLFATVHPEDRERVTTEWRNAVAACTPVHLHCRVRARLAGDIQADIQASQEAGTFHHLPTYTYSYHHWRVRAVPLLEPNGSVTEWVGAVTDITEQITQEQAIRQSEECYRGLVGASSLGVWRMRGENTMLWVSPRIAQAVGLTDDILQTFSKEVYARIHPEDVDAVMSQWRDCLTQETPFQATYRIRVLNADSQEEWRHWHERGVLIVNESIQLREWVGTIEDVTEQQDTEEAIRRSEARFRALVEASTDGVWLADPSGRIKAVSGSLEREYTMPESSNWQDMLLASGEPDAMPEQTTADRTPYTVLHRMQRRDQQFRWQQFRAVPVLAADNSVIEYIGSVQDVTERVEASEALAQSEARHRLITEAGFDGIFRADHTGQIFAASPHLLTAFGLTEDTPEEVIRTIRIPEYLHPDERDSVNAAWDHAVTTSTRMEAKVRVRVPEGKYRHWRVRVVPLLNDQGILQEWVGTVSDITEQHEAEIRLRESEARLKEAQRITHCGHFRYEQGDTAPNPEALLTLGNFWSDEMYRIFERDPALGPPSETYTTRYYTAEDLYRLQTAQERARRNGMPYIAELPITTERGTKKWIQLHHRTEYATNGQMIAIYGAVVDITAFKALEESLRQAQQLARRIALAVPDLLYVYDVEGGQMRYANRSIAAELGFTPDDMELLPYPNIWSGVGDNVKAFIHSRLHPADMSAYLAASHQLHDVADGEVVEVVARLRHQSGDWRTFYCREIIFSRDEISGAPREVLGVAQDITEKIEAEDMRRESEEKYRTLVDLLSDWVWECDHTGRYVYISGQVTRRLGYRPEEMIGLSLPDFAAREDYERLTALLQGYAQRKQAFTRLPLRVIGITGESIHLEVSGVPLVGSDGILQGFRGVAYDVTVRKQTENQLRSSEERMRRVIESSPDCMQILELSGRMLSVNEAGRRLLAMTDAEAKRGYYWPAFWEGEWRQVAEDAVTRAGSGETRRFVGFSRSSGGEGRWWDVVVTPLPDSIGSPDQLLVVSRDISAQKSLEQQKDQLLADAMLRAERDPLTELYDHQAFHKRLQEEGKRADRDNTPFAVAVLDVDNFKYFNDAFGHLEGDAVLLHITNALRSTCRPTDTIGRLGGDEFAVILPGVTKQDATRLLESRLQANAFASRWQPRGYDAPIPLRISFGVAVYPDESATPLSALSLADERLYRNKKEGQAGLLEHLREQLGKTMVGFPMLDALVTAVDSKDRYTRKHSEDVLIYAVMIGQELGLSEEELSLLRPAALLHDVGKIGVSQRILRLPTALSTEEYEAIKQHAPLGAALVEVLLANPQRGQNTPPLLDSSPASPFETTAPATIVPANEMVQVSEPQILSSDYLRQLIAAVRHHHESWDGSGYPDGLKGERIPLLARVLAVADAFSALTTDRPYRRGADPEQAVAILKAGAGQQWDARCVEAFIQVMETSRARALAALGSLSEEPKADAFIEKMSFREPR